MRMRTRLRSAIVLTVLIAAGLLVLAMTVVPSTAQKQQSRDADRVARTYERDLEKALTDLGAYVVKRRFENETDYEKLHEEVTVWMGTVPTIPTKGTTSYGRKHSRDYRNAASRRDLELRQYRALVGYLRATAVPRQDFVEAGIKLVKINPAKLLEGFIVQFSGEALRTEVVPAYRKARKRLLAQRPGSEDAELARDLRKYADDAIKMTRDGAADIDAGRAFFFDFGDKPQVLLRRLEVTERSIAGDVSQQVDALDMPGGGANTVPGSSTGS